MTILPNHVMAHARQTGKPIKRLKGGTFIGRSLWGDHPDKAGENIKCSRIVARLDWDVFETLNSIYHVEWLPEARGTIPAEWKMS